jgi:hypothetical protein
MQKENLLIVLPFPEDRSITDKIRERFPYIDVNYHQLQSSRLSFKQDQGLPKGWSENIYSHSEMLAIPLRPLSPASLISEGNFECFEKWKSLFSPDSDHLV